MYPAFDLSVLLRAITGFSARAISLRKGSGAIWLTGFRTPGGKQSENQLEQLGHQGARLRRPLPASMPN